MSVLSCERVGNASLRMPEDRMSHLPEEREVILGVDTHLDVHVAVLIDVVGRIIATTSMPTTALSDSVGSPALELRALERTARRLRDGCMSMA